MMFLAMNLVLAGIHSAYKAGKITKENAMELREDWEELFTRLGAISVKPGCEEKKETDFEAMLEEDAVVNPFEMDGAVSETVICDMIDKFMEHKITRFDVIRIFTLLAKLEVCALGRELQEGVDVEDEAIKVADKLELARGEVH